MVRFAAVGVVNTLIDVSLFMTLHADLGVLAANFLSTSAAMTFSFVVNGLFTFQARRLTMHDALWFLGTTGLTMWLVQPLAIEGLLALGSTAIVAKLLAIGACLALNFVAYRCVVWPTEPTHETGPRVSPPRGPVRRP